jgi:hypothetical protein
MQSRGAAGGRGAAYLLLLRLEVQLPLVQLWLAGRAAMGLRAAVAASCRLESWPGCAPLLRMC